MLWAIALASAVISPGKATRTREQLSARVATPNPTPDQSALGPTLLDASRNVEADPGEEVGEQGAGRLGKVPADGGGHGRAA